MFLVRPSRFGILMRIIVAPASVILGLAVFAFVVRVASRWFIFNAGRDVEYELRVVLLDRLHRQLRYQHHRLVLLLLLLPLRRCWC